MLEYARPEEAARLGELYAACVGLPGCTWSADYPTAAHAAEDIAHNDLWVVRDEKGLIIAALSVEEDEVKPFDFCKDKGPASVCIARVLVTPDYRGRGMARQMVEELKAILRERGMGYVRLLVSPGNAPALRTYLGAGFVPLGECDLYDTHWLACEYKL